MQHLFVEGEVLLNKSTRLEMVGRDQPEHVLLSPSFPDACMRPPVGGIWLTRSVSYAYEEFVTLFENMRNFLQVYQALTGHTYGEPRQSRRQTQTYLDVWIPLHTLILEYFDDPPKQTKKKEPS